MDRISLNNRDFWGWLKNLSSEKLGGYLRLIAENQTNPEYVIKLKKENDLNKSTDNIMKKLSLLMPREYFLELQFCAKTFAGICGTIFPPLVSHIEQLAYIEWLLYMEPGYPKYRDHLVHMFKVAFTGDRLLTYGDISEKICHLQFNSEKPDQPEHFKKWLKENRLILPEEADQKGILQMAFFLAAIFHDFGYGYYFHNLYQERLFKINTWLQPGTDLTDINTPFFQRFRKSLPYFFIEQHHMGCSKLDKAVEDKHKKRIISGFFRDCLPLNHSIASTFTILEIAEKFWEAGALNKKLYIAFQLAAEAIMIHDMTCKKNWLHLGDGNEDHFLNTQSYKSIPLAILLILTDELSVWKRFRIQTGQSNSQREIIFQMTDENTPQEIEIEIQDKELLITPYYKNSEEKVFNALEKKFTGKDLECLKQGETTMFMDYKLKFSPEVYKKQKAK